LVNAVHIDTTYVLAYFMKKRFREMNYAYNNGN